MGHFVGGQISWEERQQQAQVERLKEPSSLEAKVQVGGTMAAGTGGGS